jgi:hypothetical protein
VGWPEGKKFALILTHDVEGQRGLERVRQVAELEMKLGFRSSFNFIPEGKYEVPRSLRMWLVERGFEVGVHDLHHNGLLYTSRKGFCQKAARINEYLREWNAVGFRSAFMFHNLDWIQELNIRYDASTFDTDPFEPEPNGVGTIFPFYVEGTAGKEGYLELPYTLPQDSTLFLLLKNRKFSRVWQQKLSWIAECGGMALVNVHPDYMVFDGDRHPFYGYSSSNYQDFLTWLQRQYRDVFWHALPAEVAAFICSARRAQHNPARRSLPRFDRPCLAAKVLPADGF